MPDKYEINIQRRIEILRDKVETGSPSLDAHNRMLKMFEAIRKDILYGQIPIEQFANLLKEKGLPEQ